MAGIISYGIHVPRYRLSRKVIAQNMAWHEPAILGAAKGEKSVANWDEDRSLKERQIGIFLKKPEGQRIRSLQLAPIMEAY
jgi:hypothetical protein